MGSLVDIFLTTLYRIPSITMKALFLILSIAVAYSLAEQTCYQGWRMHKMHTGDGPERCNCYYFADEDTRVNHRDAQAICKGKGGFLAEVDDTDWHHVDNGWIVDTLLDIYYSDSNTPQRPLIENSEKDLGGPHYEDQWWIGARSYTGHSEEHPGEWIWEHTNNTVQWFDWAPNEPNDYHRQQCMAYVRYTSLGMTYTYHWNDWDCDSELADYICEAPCLEVP